MAFGGLFSSLFGWLLPPRPAPILDPVPQVVEEPAAQYAALVWRRRKGEVEVLLVTSRETRRWITPKGWPMRNRLPHEAAAREAYEEAGVEGTTDPQSLGAYHYDKVLKTGDIRHCQVDVFPLKLEKTLEKWPEKGQRNRKWFPTLAAAGLVDEPELAEIIRRFGEQNAKARP